MSTKELQIGAKPKYDEAVRSELVVAETLGRYDVYDIEPKTVYEPSKAKTRKDVTATPSARFVHTDLSGASICTTSASRLKLSESSCARTSWASETSCIYAASDCSLTNHLAPLF
jgi:hypothetical protein